MIFRHPVHIDFDQPLTPQVADAVATQRRLAAEVRLVDEYGDIETIAGVDVGYDLARELTKAVIAVLDFPSLELRTSVIAYAHTDFPYISGLLAFREIPAILKALECLPEPPDLLMVDGQGVAHPRRLGIAAHLGALTGLPTIGVAKSRLTGRHEPLSLQSGAEAMLTDRGERIGTVIRSKDKCNPLFVSAGHRVSQDAALSVTRQCLRGYRLPEPTRIADQISKWKLDALSTGASDVTAPHKGAKNPPPVTGDLFGMKDV